MTSSLCATGTARCSVCTSAAWSAGKNFYNDVLKRYGYEQEAEQIQDAYLAGDRKRAAALVPAELVAGMSLIGDAGYVKERIEAYRDSGVSRWSSSRLNASADAMANGDLIGRIRIMALSTSGEGENAIRGTVSSNSVRARRCTVTLSLL